MKSALPSLDSVAASLPAASQSAKPRSITRFFPVGARYLMGVPLAIFGLNGFLNFIPQPEVVMPEKALTFVTALMVSGYMMPLIAATLLVSGVLLVVNRFVPLALLFLAPFLVNSLGFHLFLEKSGLPMALVFVALELYLAWVYRAAFRPLFLSR
jgi:hypothetical protein